MNGERLRRLLAARTRADEAKAGLESVPVDEITPPGTAEVTGRIEQTADTAWAPFASIRRFDTLPVRLTTG